MCTNSPVLVLLIICNWHFEEDISLNCSEMIFQNLKFKYLKMLFDVYIIYMCVYRIVDIRPQCLLNYLKIYKYEYYIRPKLKFDPLETPRLPKFYCIVFLIFFPFSFLQDNIFRFSFAVSSNYI